MFQQIGPHFLKPPLKQIISLDFPFYLPYLTSETLHENTHAHLNLLMYKSANEENHFAKPQ